MFFSLAVVYAHFTLYGSREQAKWPLKDDRFWPIGGGAVLRPGNTDCLLLPPAKPLPVPSGPYTIHWEIGNGAHHVGQCDAFLIDKKTGVSEKIGSQLDCVSLTQSLQVDLSKHSCKSCVIKATVAAAHIGPAAIEFYDACIDIEFTTGASNSNLGAQGVPADGVMTANTSPSTTSSVLNVAPAVGELLPLPKKHRCRYKRIKRVKSQRNKNT